MSEAPHLLSLKVLRLSRPTFSVNNVLHIDNNTQLPGDAPLRVILAAEQDMLETGSASVSSSLVLPPAFGSIYLGETFSCYLCVNNESAVPIQDLAFKAELQTTSQRFTLADTPGQQHQDNTMRSSSHGSLLPAQSAEFIIHHEIKELGIHILVCSVQYTPMAKQSERKFFRKFYKFQVLNPLTVKTKVNARHDAVFLEAQVQNVAQQSMFVERLVFEPSEWFEAQDMNREALVTIGPQDTRQYLYLLRPRKKGDAATRLTPQLGLLDISWRTQLGEHGRLQTAQLLRKAPMLEPFDVTVVQQPQSVRVEQPFSVTVRITNQTIDDKLRISLKGVKSRMNHILMRGSSHIDAGLVEPSSYVEVQLEFFALVTGIQRIVGIQVADKISGIVKDLDALAVIRIVL